LSCWTSTDWAVISDFASRIYSASSLAWINAFLVYACLVLRAFGANNAFGSTSRRGSNIIGQTTAYSLIVQFATLRVCATRRWSARILWSYRIFDSRITSCKWISCVSFNTRASWNVIDNFTICILSTSSRARINAFVSQASSISAAVRIENAFRSATVVRIALIFG
jgi:hypothetical protein